MSDLSYEMTQDLQSIVDDYGCAIMRFARLIHVSGFISTAFCTIDPFKWNPGALRKLMVREPGKDFFSSDVGGFVDHSDVAAECIVEPFQAIKDSGDFRDRVIIDSVEVFWCDVTQPVGNDDITQIDDYAAFLFCHSMPFLNTSISY